MPKKSEANPISRGWVITINNPTEQDLLDCKVVSQEADFMIVGAEVGDKGTPHYQAYAYWKDKKTFKKLQKMLPRGHLIVAVGTAEQNDKYCSKQGNVIFRSGECPKQGKRTDIDGLRELLKEKPKMRDITEETLSPQHVRMAEIYLKYHEKARDWKPEVRWYHGSTGAGKTRAAREWLEKDIYTCLNNGKFWEGYDAHENVLIDDFRKDFCKFHELLKILDRYEYRVEVKGSSRQMLARKIAITCPYPPDRVYATREDVQQLIRRIDKIELVGKLVEDPEDEELCDI